MPIRGHRRSTSPRCEPNSWFEPSKNELPTSGGVMAFVTEAWVDNDTSARATAKPSVM